MTRNDRHYRIPDPVVLTLCVLTLIFCFGAVGRQGRRRAKDMVCLANLGRWGVCFESYTKDHDGKFNPGHAVDDTELWMNALRPYYQGNRSLLLCPSTARVSDNFGDPGTFAAWDVIINLPEGGTRYYVSGYGINSWTNCVPEDRSELFNMRSWKTTKGVRQPETVPVFADSTWCDAWPARTDGPLPYPHDSGEGDTRTFGEINMFNIDRHGGAVNFLFMDFSARKVGLKELWMLRWHRHFDTEGLWTTAGGVQSADWPEWMRNFKDY